MSEHRLRVFGGGAEFPIDRDEFRDPETGGLLEVVPGESLQLYAQMKLPGEAWLSFETQSTPNGAILRQTALFVPRGLVGRLYWYLMFPFHLAIFGRMARKLAEAAEERGKLAEPVR